MHGLTARLDREGARLIALDQLNKAVDAARRTDDPHDEEALHDFRVALRRLRATHAAYERLLSGTVSKKWSRRLRKLMRETNGARDGEVHIDWLAKQVREHGIAWDRDVEELDAALKHQTQVGYGKLRTKAVPTFYGFEPRLREQLDTYYQLVRISGSTERQVTFGEAASDLVRAHANVLWNHLARIRLVEDQGDVHDARIAGKRLRYLLEPLQDDHAEIKGLLKWLKRLQDSLGDVNDMHNMAGQLAARRKKVRVRRTDAPGGAQTSSESQTAEVAQQPGSLERLIAICKDRRDAHFKRFCDLWQSGSGDDFLADTHKLAARMNSQGRAGKETTRIFLLSRFPSQARRYPASDVFTGWIRGPRIVEEVARVKSKGGEVYRRAVTFQGIDQVQRAEEDVPHALFDRLWRLTRGQRLRHRQYTIKTEQFPIWFVERYPGRSVVLARVLVSGEQKIPAPDWLQDVMVREVTGDQAFTQQALAD